jgi:hypothetical protein
LSNGIEDESPKTPLQPRFNPNLFQLQLRRISRDCATVCSALTPGSLAPQGPAALQPYLLAQSIVRKSLFISILSFKSFNLNILRLPMTSRRQQPKWNH